MRRKDNGLRLEEVEIIFKNFSGEKGPYNSEGERGFSVLLTDQDLVANLLDEGWNVKELRVEDDEPPAWHLPVKVNYNGRIPPRISAIKTDGRMVLTLDTVAYLDYTPIAYADMIINPYQYDVNGAIGISAYLRSLYAVIDEDEFDRKYSDIPELV